MNLYLDDDTAERRLIAILQRAGHTVIIPSDAGLIGAVDAKHFIYACRSTHVLMTRNHDDFLDLHEVVRATGGSHPGILVIRSDNDSTRDMTTRSIAAAVARLEASGMTVADQFVILNRWR